MSADEARLTAFLSSPFTVAGAAAHGIGRAALRRWLRDGDTRMVLRGAYVGSHVPDSPTLRARAFALMAPDAVICGRTAAWIWGIGAAGTHDRRGRPLPVEAAVPGSATPPRRSGVLGRSWTFEKGETTRVAGLQATTPLRTAADLGRTWDLGPAVAVADAFLHSRQFSKRQLEDTVARFHGYAGVRQLADVARLADGRSASTEETRLRLALHMARIPAPEPGWQVVSAFGRVLHRFTLAWPLVRLAVDLDRTPLSTGAAPAALPAIRLRHRSIGGVGWRVLECGPGEITSYPDTLMARIRAELRAAEDTRDRAA
ncbi:hypothetical protein [Yinghuangia soli]|uniref:Transcriptional regulator, AbiEi antitoxin, Type IV TA system n=1 Tax=Yinghuangia soli TaxID=2908204 RepID=A0AA41Q724_9ACTN|nr:hypothetical protein [Yinghuangia soli]MCF2532795.1 hypothetical protein [Yinghuangia soli]